MGYKNLQHKNLSKSKDHFQSGWDDHYNGHEPKPPKDKAAAKRYEEGRLGAIEDQNKAENPDYED